MPPRMSVQHVPWCCLEPEEVSSDQQLSRSDTFLPLCGCRVCPSPSVVRSSNDPDDGRAGCQDPSRASAVGKDDDPDAAKDPAAITVLTVGVAIGQVAGRSERATVSGMASLNGRPPLKRRCLAFSLTRNLRGCTQISRSGSFADLRKTCLRIPKTTHRFCGGTKSGNS